MHGKVLVGLVVVSVQRVWWFGCIAIVFVTHWLSSQCDAADWPRYRGPSNDGVSSERRWLVEWPQAGPPVAWRTDVGIGYSSVVISQNRLYTMGNRDNVDTVFCLDATSGEQLWTHDYECPTDANEFEGGPTATPTVDRDSVYTLSRVGDLFCFDAKTGAVKWRVNVPEVTAVRTPGWGFSSSPWVTEELVIVNVGDAGVALSTADGSVQWTSADKDAGYSSFVPFVQDGESCLIFGSARSYVCVNARTGVEKWRQRWLTTFGCNAANALIVKDRVFLSSGYNRGSALLEIQDGKPVILWKHKSFQTQLASSLMINGLLYGANGAVSEGASLTCMRLEDGEVLWEAKDEKVGGLTAAGNHLITISEDGWLKVILANAKGPRTVSQFRVLDEQCWTVPVLCNGRIYCRGASGGLVCLDVRLQN